MTDEINSEDALTLSDAVNLVESEVVWCIRQLDPGEGGSLIDSTEYERTCRALSHLTSALKDLRALVPAPVAASPIDPALLGRVAWHASQTAGCSTMTGDQIAEQVARAVEQLQAGQPVRVTGQ